MLYAPHSGNPNYQVPTVIFLFFSLATTTQNIPLRCPFQFWQPSCGLHVPRLYLPYKIYKNQSSARVPNIHNVLYISTNVCWFLSAVISCAESYRTIISLICHFCASGNPVIIAYASACIANVALTMALLLLFFYGNYGITDKIDRREKVGIIINPKGYLQYII